ncbi:dexamethasone-induced protein isoform X2 [Sminthopsis crassicaudata]|uniref:dexamethasone-induced protein isoform X2 n=1 Tax=Sminthopsis crassicaudata TaxID=9301 RepID=UPI003D6928C4
MTLTALQRKPSGLSQLVLPGPECLGQADAVGHTGVATDDVFPPSRGPRTMPSLVLKTCLPTLKVHHNATPGINGIEKCSSWKGTQTGMERAMKEPDHRFFQTDVLSVTV